MNCPKCHEHSTQVLDSRDCSDGIRRRRRCQQCNFRFTTYERVEAPLILVIKKNGDKERFDPEKIKRGVAIACKNRPVTTAQIESLVIEVEQKVYLSSKEEVSSQEIGMYVQEILQAIDQISYLRFTSVYQSFADLQQFEQEIHNIN